MSNNPEMVGVAMSERQVTLPPFVNGERNPKRLEMAEMLKGSNITQNPIVIENILPKFLKIANKGSADPISKLMVGDKDNGENFSILLYELSLVTKINYFLNLVFYFLQLLSATFL